MKKELTLLVLAAGMGSRFGGLKQIEPVGPNGEFIIDYSIYDAIKAGFNKVVFVIKKENYDIFKNSIGKRLSDKIKIEYVFQELSDLPKSIALPKERIKPLGTAHAVYAARNNIHGNFAMINADDFYGYDGLLKASEFLNNCNELEYANVVYEVGKTITKNGAVKRGIIFEENGYLKDIKESSVIEKNGRIEVSPLNGEDTFYINSTDSVSMNLLCFTPKIFEYLNNNIEAFFLNCKDLLNDEYQIPRVAFLSSIENKMPIKVIKTNSNYYGMTYKEDLEELKEGIKGEIDKGYYNNNLWGK